MSGSEKEENKSDSSRTINHAYLRGSLGHPMSKSKKKRWPIIALVFFVLLGAGIYFIFTLLKKPSIGNVRMSEIKQPIIAEKPKENERFEGEYISFAHLTSYREKKHTIETEEGKNILERAFFSEEGINAKKIALTVEKLSGGNMEESANYNMRETYPDRYKKEKFRQGAVQGIAFSLNGHQSFEKVIFIQNGNLLAELALTSSLPPDDGLNLEIENVAGSIQWLK